MPSTSTFWLLRFPSILGYLTIVVIAVLFIRWDMQQLSMVPRRSPIPSSLKLTAIAPLAAAVLLFNVEQVAWRLASPSLGPLFVKPVYTDEISRVVARCILNIFFAAITYLASDKLCHRLLRSPFPRPGKQPGSTGADLNQYAYLSQALPPNEQIG